MIIKLDEAQKLDANITEHDILALESAIRAHTNNKFRLQNYRGEIIHVAGDIIYTGKYNLFVVGDSIEVSGTQFYDGYYVVREVKIHPQGFCIKVDAPIDVSMDDVGYIYKLVYPADVKSGAIDVIKHKLDMAKRQGIKSKTISRMSITYDTPEQNEQLVYGVSANQFDFLAPHMKMGWT